MQESEEVGGLPVKACCDASKVFELVEAAFDGVADLICLEIIPDRFLAGWIARDDGFGAHFRDEFAQGVGIIGLVGQHPARRKPIKQGRGKRCIAALTGCEDDLQRSAKRIDSHVDFGCQSSSGTPQSLVPPF